MENAAEALKMAAAVLIFVLALSISINSFSEVRQTSQTILNYRDREYDTTYVEDNGSTERIVGAETIIPTIYKSYKENYKIIFDFIKESNYKFDCLYEKKVENEGNITWEKINYIDLQNEILGVKQKEQFIQAILYGYNSFGGEKDNIISEFKNLGVQFVNEDGIIKSLNEGQSIKESLGVYYQEDVDSETKSEISEVNKTEKRVIIYSYP